MHYMFLHPLRLPNCGPDSCSLQPQATDCNVRNCFLHSTVTLTTQLGCRNNHNPRHCRQPCSDTQITQMDTLEQSQENFFLYAPDIKKTRHWNYCQFNTSAYLLRLFSYKVSESQLTLLKYFENLSIYYVCNDYSLNIFSVCVRRDC